jgi:hypothetical protein
MLTVHLRVNDEATGKPTPVRLRITDAGGTYRPPLGRLAHFALAPGLDVGGQVELDGRVFAFIDGACEARLPPGQLHVAVSKGPEYAAIERELTLTAGQMALRLEVARWADDRARGWYAGDLRAHDLSPHAAALEGAAEGLDVVQLLARELPPAEGRPPAIPGLLAFSGTQAALPEGPCLVAVNTLNTHPVLGSVSLLNCHRPVFPLRFGAPGEPDHWSVADWCDQCHRKPGLVVWPDLPRLRPDSPQGEALAALVLGKIDAFEITPSADPQPKALADYYRLLDCGLRPALVGSSGKDSNAQVLGAMRTYARLSNGEALTPATWTEAVRAGRTYATTAPLLSLSVAGHGPGSTVAARPDEVLRLRAEARSAVPFERVELLVNGELQAATTAGDNQTAAVVETDITARESLWIAARCRSPRRLPAGACVFAHTSPVHVAVEGRPLRPSAEAISPLLEVLDATRAWVEGRARPESEKQRDHLRQVLDAARAALLARQGG